MTTARPKVLLICDQRTHDAGLRPADTERLCSFANWEWFASTVDRPSETSKDAALMSQLMERVVKSMALSSPVVHLVLQRTSSTGLRSSGPSG